MCVEKGSLVGSRSQLSEHPFPSFFPWASHYLTVDREDAKTKNAPCCAQSGNGEAMDDNPFSFILAHTAGGTRGRSETLQQENGGANSLAPSSSHDSLSSLACETPSKASRGLLGKTSSPATGGKKPQQQQQQLLKTASFRRMDSPCSTVTPQKQQTLALNRNRSSSKDSKPLPFPLQYNAPSSSTGPSLARGGGGVPTSTSSSRQLLPPAPAPAPPSACKTLNKVLVAKNSLGAGLGPMNVSINKALLNRQREAVRRIRNQRAEDFSAPLEASAEEVEVVRRRQSIAITTEIKNLVRAAEAEVAEAEGGQGGGGGVDAEAEAEADVFADLPLVASPPPSPSPALLSPPAAPRLSDALDGRKRESLALDSALIGKMLPRKVQLQVRQGKPVPPEFFGNVSIFFSDVVGFTNISAAVEPLQVIRLLVRENPWALTFYFHRHLFANPPHSPAPHAEHTLHRNGSRHVPLPALQGGDHW